MQVDAYLARIGYSGPLQPDLNSLRELHRAHLLGIPYENLDIHLSRRLTLDEAQIYTKIVERRRGGWCYEMNGLFAWALRELGFRVQLLSSAVGFPPYEQAMEGGHLVLLVELEQPYLADVGFGNGYIEPLPLAAGSYRQGALSYGLRSDGERWFFTNHQHGGPGYTMLLRPRQLADFAAPCHQQQTDPDSGFVRTAVCHRFTADGMVSLRGAVLSELRGDELTRRTIEDGASYAALLEQVFDLRLPETAALWEQVWASHQVWRAAQEHQA